MVYTKGQRCKKFIPSLQFANRIAEGTLFAPLLLQRLESAALPSGHEPLYFYDIDTLQMIH